MYIVEDFESDEILNQKLKATINYLALKNME